MQPRALATLISVALFVPAALSCDGPGLLRQSLLGAATLGMVLLLVRGGAADPRDVFIAMAVATTGEIILSLGLGLYEYRHAVIPLYVPFGHGLFYALAVQTARQPVFRDHPRRVVRGTLVVGSAVAAFTLIAFDDVWGLLWWIAAAGFLVRSRNAVLLAVCFSITMVMEWTGTALGNWMWAAEVPGLGLQSANPPSGVGILYILLDLITVGIAGALATRRGLEPVIARSEA